MTLTLAHIHVHECMHTGIVSCGADEPLAVVAGLMAGHQVHAIAVAGGNGGRPLGVVSDRDVVSAAAAGALWTTAGEAAITEPLAVSTGDTLEHAAQLMAEHEVAHLIVIDAASGHPVGILSTLDIAAVVAAD
jgi:CBS domain-containing protein